MPKYRCIHCGTYFEDKEYEDIIDSGWDSYPSDTCENCADMLRYTSHDINELHSDADPGL